MNKNTAQGRLAFLTQNRRLVLTLIAVFIIGTIGMSAIGISNALAASSSRQITNTDLALSLQPMGNLTTVQVKVAKLEVKATMGIGLNCKFSGTYLMNGEIEAGINLTNLTEDSISYNEQTETYLFSLPQPQLTRCDFTPERYVSDNQFCFRPTFNDLREIAKYEASVEMIQDTLDAGLINRSEREATILMENLINTLTGKATEIDFVEPDTDPLLPQSCNPEPPSGFGKNADGTWVGNS